MNNEAAQQEALGADYVITPSELINAEFKTNIFGGYSKNQVDILLERAAEAFEAMLRENQELKRSQTEMQHELDKYRDMETALRSALVSSQKMGENMVTSAKLQADALVEEARAVRAQAVFKMEKLPAALRAEIQRLVDARERLRDDLAALLLSHEKMAERIPRAEDGAEDFVKECLKNTDFTVMDSDTDEEGPGDAFRSASPDLHDQDQVQDRNGDQGYVNF